MTSLGPLDDFDGLVATIRGHSGRAPFDPWIFFRRGPDWRWISWQQGHEMIGLLLEAVAAVRAPGAIGYPGILDPRLVLATWASEAADRPCLRLTRSFLPSRLAPEAEAKGCAAWWQITPPERHARGVGEPPECLVVTGSMDPSPGPASSGGETDLCRLLESLGGAEDERDVAFLGRGLSETVERAFLRWVMRSGAALLLEDDGDSVPAMLHWSRPTVAAVAQNHLSTLASGLSTENAKELRRLKRHHRRWRAVLVGGEEGSSCPESEAGRALSFVEKLGVEVLLCA